MRITAGIRIYPNTELAGQALKEGVISPTTELLEPRFYLAPDLHGWIRRRLAEYQSSRSGVII